MYALVCGLQIPNLIPLIYSWFSVIYLFALTSFDLMLLLRVWIVPLVRISFHDISQGAKALLWKQMHCFQSTLTSPLPPLHNSQSFFRESNGRCRERISVIRSRERCNPDPIVRMGEALISIGGSKEVLAGVGVNGGAAGSRVAEGEEAKLVSIRAIRMQSRRRRWGRLAPRTKSGSMSTRTMRPFLKISVEAWNRYSTLFPFSFFPSSSSGAPSFSLCFLFFILDEIGD